jgi:hypothetical protein
MNELVKHEKQEVSIRQKDIMKVIADVNMLQGFPIQFDELKVWSADIERLSGASNDELIFLFDCFKTNELVWDRNMGIQNIFNGLKLVWGDNGVLKLRKTVW